MSWENLTGIATRTHLRVFGENVTITFVDGRELQTKAILTPHMTHLRDHNSDLESYALIASVSKKDVQDPQSVSEILIQGKTYHFIKHKIDPDGFYVFFLSE